MYVGGKAYPRDLKFTDTILYNLLTPYKNRTSPNNMFTASYYNVKRY